MPSSWLRAERVRGGGTPSGGLVPDDVDAHDVAEALQVAIDVVAPLDHVESHGEDRVVQDAAGAADPGRVRVAVAGDAVVGLAVPAAVGLLVLLHLQADEASLAPEGAPGVF